MIIRIRPLLDLRSLHRDQALLDYLQLVTLAPTPGTVTTSDLRERWCCSQPHVSRRLAAVARTGLVDITPGWGAYRVHHVEALHG
jgi:Mn-dependent DtxR family transcriptional regulator